MNRPPFAFWRQPQPPTTFAELFGLALKHLWADDYDDATGTWPDSVGGADVDNDVDGIPPKVTFNGHDVPALTFLGTDKSLTGPSVTTLDGKADFCIFVAFVWPTSTDNSGVIFGILDSGIQFDFEYNFGNSSIYATINNGSGPGSIAGTTPCNDGKVHHAVINCVAGNIELLIDGVSQGTDTGVTLGDYSPGSILHFGKKGISRENVTPIIAGIATTGLNGVQLGYLESIMTAWHGAPTYPVVTSVTPSTGSDAGGDSVTVAGSGFQTGARVFFGGDYFSGVEATSVVVVDPNTITCDTPAHADGAVDVYVVNPDWTDDFGVAVFTYSAAGSAPTVSAAEPVDVLGGDVSIVTVDDTTGITDMKVQGVSVPFFIVSSTKVAIVTPANTSALYDVSATNAFGTGTGSNVLYYHNPNDANTTLLLERGAYVGDTWTDRSASGFNFDDPTYAPTETNKEPQFDSGDYLDGTCTPADLFGTTTTAGDTYSVSLAFRIKETGLASTGNTYEGNAIFSDLGQYVGAYYSDSWIRWMHFRAATDFNAEISGAPSLDELHVLDVECDNGSLRARLDGGAWTTPVATGGAPAVMSSHWFMGDGLTPTQAGHVDMRCVQVSASARGDTWFDQNIAWLRSKHGAASTAGSEPEIDSADSDVFDPAGGDRIFVTGRNLTGASGYVGDTALTNEYAFGAIPQSDGVDDTLTGANLSTYVAAAAGTFTFVFYADEAVADNTNAYDLPGIFGDTFGLSVAYSVAGLRIGVYDVAWNQLTIPAAVKAWHVGQLKWDGATLYGRVDGGPWFSVACGSVNLSHALQLLAQSTNGAHYLHGLLGLVLGIDSTQSDAVCDDIVKAINYKCGFNFGGLGAVDQDFSTYAWTLYLKPGDYTAGTWAGSASAGSSGSNDFTQATGSLQPRVSDGEHLVATMPAKSAGTYPLTIVTSVGEVALTNAIEFYSAKDDATCEAWYDTRSITGTVGGGSSVIPNQSTTNPGTGGDRDLTETEGTASLAAAAEFGGANVIQFGGDAAWDTADWTAHVSQPLRVYWVAKWEAIGDLFLADSNPTGSADRVAVLDNTTDTSIYLFAGSNAITDTSPRLVTSAHVGCGEFNYPTSMKIFLDDPTKDLFGGTDQGGPDALGSVRLGAKYDDTSFFTGKWAAYGVFSGTATPNENRRIMKMLGARYQIDTKRAA